MGRCYRSIYGVERKKVQENVENSENRGGNGEMAHRRLGGCGWVRV